MTRYNRRTDRIDREIDRMPNVHVFCFFASYVVAFGLEWTRLVKLNALSRWVILLFALAGLTAHTLYLLARSGQTNLPPLLSSTHDWMLVLAWLGVLLYVFVSLADRDIPIGLFFLPLVLVLIGAAHFVSDSPNPRMLADPEQAERAFKSWAMLHASMLVFGIAGVLTGLTLSMMYLVQHRRLKHKQPGHSGLSFPNLERLARWNRWSVMTSVPLLTLGLATGVGLALFSRNTQSPVSLTDPVILANGIVWLVMVGLFGWLIRTERPAGRQIAWMTIWACGFLLVTLVGLQVAAGGAHGKRKQETGGRRQETGVEMAGARSHLYHPVLHSLRDSNGPLLRSCLPSPVSCLLPPA